MSESFEDIERRCEAAGIEFEHDEGDESLLILWFPRGRETYDLFVEPGFHAEWVANEPFEEYIRLKGYEASWSRNDQIIECNLVLSDANYSPLFYSAYGLLSAALKRLDQAQHQAPSGSPRVSFEPVKGLLVLIGWCSNVHAFIQEATGYSGWNAGNRPVEVYSSEDSESEEVEVQQSLTLQILGTDATDHDSAVELLERIGNSLLFQIDLTYELGLALERERSRDGRPRWYSPPYGDRGRRESFNPLPPMKYQYDSEAMSLYWYAKAAAEQPLLQFLAYYQIIEFYFSKYAQSKALTTIRNVLKDPRFDTQRDTDVMRVFEAIKINSKGRFRREDQQLEAAIEHCIQSEDLRAFLLGDDERYSFHASEQQTKVARTRISLRGPSFDHRKDVARRIYELRCRIVHTKAGYDEQEPLLPFDPEVKYLLFDIDLIEFLARKVLIDASSSQPLQT